MEIWNEPDDDELRNRKHLEEHKKKKPRRRRPEPLITKEEVEERIKSMPPEPELIDEEKKVKKLERQNEKLEKQVRSKNAKLANLKVGLGATFYIGQNRLVTYHYGKEIQAYLSIRYASIHRATEDNKGENSCYPFLYRTNALLLKKQFKISKEAATKIIRFLTDSGAWRQIKIEPGKIYIYQLGERKKVKYQTNGKWEHRPQNSFYFNLYKNSKSLRFFKQERERLSGEYREKEKCKEQQEERKREIEKLNAKIDKMILLHNKDHSSASANGYDEFLRLVKGRENYGGSGYGIDGDKVEGLSYILENLKKELGKKNWEKYGRFKRRNQEKQ